VSTLRQQSSYLEFETHGPGLYEITTSVTRWASTTGVNEGLLTLFIRHTSASLLIQENADPAVQTDLSAYFDRIAPEDPARYMHRSEGPDDMPAHLRAALTQTHLSIPIMGGQPAIGTWQGIYLFEHRNQPHQRTVAVHLLGD